MIMETNMTNEKALDILERHNLWRRGADYVEATNPKLLGMAIDKAIEVLRLSIVSGSLPKDTDGCGNDKDKCSCKNWGGCPVD